MYTLDSLHGAINLITLYRNFRIQYKIEDRISPKLKYWVLLIKAEDNIPHNQLIENVNIILLIVTLWKFSEINFLSKVYIPRKN